MNVNIFLFPDFETLDAFGPVEVLGRIEEYRLHYVSVNGGLVTSKQGIPVLTEKIADTDPSGILLIPGGMGTRPLLHNADFLEELAGMAKPSAYCLTVCTGSALLAQAGLLDGKKATTNKMAFETVRSLNQNVIWLGRARWVVDGKYYTSSGISAGIDMALGFAADRFGREKANKIAQHIEYIWNADQENDPFAK